jgi:uncharacterized membrane protein YdjX (TVP38/TMEM64 family)
MHDENAATSEEPPSRWKQLGPTGLLALLWTIAPAVAGIALLGHMGQVSDWLLARPGTGLSIYVAVFIIAAGCGLLPTYAQAIVGGWVFGFMVGLPAALLGFTGAALLGYGISRCVSHDKVEQRINENAKARAVRDALVGHGPWRTFFIVALLRLPPNSPFALTNLAMASTGVALVPYVAGTFFGMLPRTAVAIFFAAMASREAYDIQEFLSEGPGPIVLIAGLVVLFIVLGVIGVIANQALERLDVNRNGNEE